MKGLIIATVLLASLGLVAPTAVADIHVWECWPSCTEVETIPSPLTCYIWLPNPKPICIFIP